MAVPKKLRIPYEDDDDGRFNAVGRLPDGTHIGTCARLGGFDIEGRKVTGDKAFAQLQEMYEELAGSEEPEFRDIWVKLFSVEINGVRHGLFYEHIVEGEGNDRYEGEHVMLEPRDIMFHPPWDSGNYST